MVSKVIKISGGNVGCATSAPLINKKKLDALYAKYNRRQYVHPDPLEFLYRYDDKHDREIVGMVASSLAYGTVTQILRSVSSILEKVGAKPSVFLANASRKSIQRTFNGFKHRFTTGDDIADLLWGIKSAIEKHGSLHACFTYGYDENDETILPALASFVRELKLNPDGDPCYLLPCPTAGSACKRLNLFMRWMVRRDDVDPGGWYNVPASRLIVPLDRHMHSISLALGITKRKQPDMRTAVEITEAFRVIVPQDPVRYDFALTRLGIRDDADMGAFLEVCSIAEVS